MMEKGEVKLLILILEEWNDCPNFKAHTKIFELEKILRKLDNPEIENYIKHKIKDYRENEIIIKGFLDKIINDCYNKYRIEKPITIGDLERSMINKILDTLDRPEKYVDDYFEII